MNSHDCSLRWARGQDRSIALAATNVLPPEVIFQAFTLLGKATQLQNELTGHTAREPTHQAPAFHSPLPCLDRGQRCLSTHTRVTAESWHDRAVRGTPAGAIGNVLERIRRHCAREPVIRSADFADPTASRRISAGNRGDAAHAAFIAAVRLPDDDASGAPLERGTRPEDVYVRLLECFALIAKIVDQSGIEGSGWRMAYQNAALVAPRSP